MLWLWLGLCSGASVFPSSYLNVGISSYFVPVVSPSRVFKGVRPSLVYIN